MAEFIPPECRLQRLNNHGMTLIEVIMGVCILAAAGGIGSVAIVKGVQFQHQNKMQAAAAQLAENKLNEIAQNPYHYIKKTTWSSAQQALSGTCDCRAPVDVYDSQFFPPETKFVSGVPVTLKVCVGEVTSDTSTINLTPHCPSASADSGVRALRVRAEWQTTSVPKSVDYLKVVTNEIPRQFRSAIGTFDISVCKALATDPTQCDPNAALIVGAQVVLDKISPPDVAAYGATVLASNPTDANGHHVWQEVSPLSAYSLSVTKPGFFLNTTEPLSVSDGSTTTVHVRLRAVPDYAAAGVTEVFLADHPVISKISCLADCTGATDDSEALEFYNPTTVPVTIPQNQIVFNLYNPASPLGPITLDMVTATSAPSCQAPIVIPPKGHFLLIGKTGGGTCPSAVTFGGVPVQADIVYNQSAYWAVGAVRRGLLTCEAGGATLGSYDSVGWVGPGILTAMSSTEGGPAPGMCVAGVYSSLIRMGRRGAYMTRNAGDPLGPWAPSYDTNNNSANFIRLWDPSLLHLKSSVDTTLAATGMPAEPVLTTGATVQASDPTSPMAITYEQENLDVAHMTAIATLPGMFGLDATAAHQSPLQSYCPAYHLTAVSGHYARVSTIPTILGRLSANNPATQPWTALPQEYNASLPTSCLTTATNSCDADSWSVPRQGSTYDPLVPDYTIPSYPPEADARDPYMVLDSTAAWGVLTGVIQTVGISPVPLEGISVEVSVPGVACSYVTKLTDVNGRFSILMATTVPLQVTFNTGPFRRPFYDSVAGWTAQLSATDFGTVLTHNVSLPARPLIGPLAPSGPGCLDGHVTALETGGPIQDQVVRLLDQQGDEFASVATDALGYFRIAGIPTASIFRVTAASARNQSLNTSPPNYDITITNGVCPQRSNLDFVVSGVPARLDVGAPSGALVVASTFTLPGVCALPPSIDQRSTRSMVSSGMADTSGTAHVTLPPGSNYYICCWLTRSSGDGMDPGRINGSGSPVQILQANVIPQGILGGYTCSP